LVLNVIFGGMWNVRKVLQPAISLPLSEHWGSAPDRRCPGDGGEAQAKDYRGRQIECAW